MTDEIAGWHARLPERAGHGIAAALRQTLDAAVRWKRMNSNPAKLAGRNPKPPVRTVRAFTGAEVDAIALELSAIYRPMPALAAATGLRPKSGKRWSGAMSTAAGRRLRLPHRLVWRGGGAGQHERKPPAGAAVAPGAGSARRDTATARYAAAVPGSCGRVAEHRQLPALPVGSGDSHVRGRAGPGSGSGHGRRYRPLPGHGAAARPRPAWR
jgi:hypothetical protein